VMRGNSLDSSDSLGNLEQAAKGAPAGEPEVWDEAVQEFNPRFGHHPKPEPVRVSPTFDVAGYLAGERAKDLLRFSTAGSVDDGKSTLIGRLLYDTQSIYDDQVKSIEGKGTTAPGVLDLALLTDGLRAEREQGITIDVAYRYFATARRKFIIADTPGHEQYTRNMATGASTADVAVVLVDARKGVLKQSRRHASITALLGVPQILVAVNKMDLVDWDESTFDGIRREFTRFFRELESFQHATALHFVPVSALAGDNVVRTSNAMPWYTGPTLLGLLEELPSSAYRDIAAPFRFPVQRVARPNLDFRGFAGQIAAGTVRPGDEVMVLPSGQRSRVARIVTFDGDLESATAPLSVTLTLADEIDISRGDMLVAPQEAGPKASQVATRFDASLVWMSPVPLDFGRRYLLKQASRTVQAHVRVLHRSLDFSGDAVGAALPLATLGLNDIGLVAVETLLPLSVDLYEANRHTGSFILIDAETNATVAACMIRSIGNIGKVGGSGEPAPVTSAYAVGAYAAGAPVSPAERAAAWGHGGAHILISNGIAGGLAFADAMERALFTRGVFAVRSQDGGLAALGALVVSHQAGDEAASVTIHASGQTRTETLPRELPAAVAQAVALLRAMGVLTRPTTGVMPKL